MYLMLTGRPPFNGTSNAEIAAKILHLKYDKCLLYNSDLSGEAIKLITLLLEPDPKLRITALEAIAHDWFDQTRQ